MNLPRQPGTLPEIPGFEIQARIGQGRLGDVYKSIQLAQDRTVAVRLLRDELASDAGFRERFDREWAAYAALNHPNIVQALEAGEHNGLWYVVQEYMAGGSLAGRLERNQILDESRALSVIESVANALEHVQKTNSTIHGDLRPANILFTTKGIAKVADFFYVAPGEHPYGSPVTGTSEQERIDFKPDIYSLGATLYHSVTGREPRMAGSDGNPGEDLSPGLESVDSVNSSLSEPFTLFMEKLLIRFPQVQYGSWEEAMADLRSVQGGHRPQRLPPMGASAMRRSACLLSPGKDPPPHSPPLPEGEKVTVEKDDAPPSAPPAAVVEDSTPSTGSAPTERARGPKQPKRPPLTVKRQQPEVPEPQQEQQEQFITVREKRKQRSRITSRPLAGVAAVIVIAICSWYMWDQLGRETVHGNRRLILSDTTPEPPVESLESQEPKPPVEVAQVITNPPPAPPQEEQPAPELETPRFPTAFADYLDVMEAVLKQTARRQYRHAEGTLRLWLGTRRDHPYLLKARRQLERIQTVATLEQVVEDNEASVVEARIAQGHVIGIGNGKIEVRPPGEEGRLRRSIDFEALNDPDFDLLLRLADTPRYPFHGTMYMLSRLDFASAAQLLHKNKPLAQQDAKELKEWIKEWQGLHNEFLAQEVVDGIKLMAGRGEFRQAARKLKNASGTFADTETFEWHRKAEIHALREEVAEVVARMDEKRQAVQEGNGKSPARTITAEKLGRRPEIETHVKPQRKGEGGVERVSIRVRLKNREPRVDFEGLTQHVFAIARHPYFSDQYRVLIKESDSLSLPSGGAYEFTTRTTSIEAASIPNAHPQFADFGWLLLLKDHAGGILLTKSSWPVLRERSADIEKVAEGSDFTL